MPPRNKLGALESRWLEAELLAERDVVKVRFHAGRVTTVYSKAYFQLAVRVGFLVSGSGL